VNLSVVIPSYKSDATLARCLQSVLEAAREQRFPIIVVDSSPTPIPDDFKSRYPQVQFIQSATQLFAGAARNVGAKKVSSEWICFLDSDCLWVSDWLRVADDALRNHASAQALIGQIRYEKPSSSVDFALHLMEFHEFTSTKKWHPRFVCSGNLLIRRKLFERIGGFREDIPMCTDFTFAVAIDRDEFRNIYFIPELAITHLSHFTDPSQIFKKVEAMGYWRGFVENQIPDDLKISKNFWFNCGKKILSEIFLIGITLRACRVRSCYLKYYLTHFVTIHKLCRSWSRGFLQGLSACEK
jgi:GT2 family glycosyltransferase